MRDILIIFWILGAISPASAQNIKLDIDISQAERLLEITCSNIEIDPGEWSDSEPLQAQLAHHREFAERFSFENYIIGLNHISRCETPSSDPFRFSALVKKRTEMRNAITFLSQNREQLTARVIELLQPYVPEGYAFEGKVVLAGASFSCGGFQNKGIFFVDIPCLAADIEGEYEAITRLIAHETYHAMQNDFAYLQSPGLSKVKSLAASYDFMFERLALEGSASHIGDMREIKGSARYSNFSRSLARRNYRHLDYNFRLFDYMIEAINRSPADIGKRFPEIYGLAFDGSFGEHSYFVGQQMTAEIEHSFGASAIPCLFKLPFENYVLAYDFALQDGKNLKKSAQFSAETIKIANDRGKTRTSEPGFRSCITSK
ncbi:DUF5700 domain-containing putative Zn-dependent protease [Parasphingorhabdus sp.]|uniref:DUF5700 domain-containing putative Zn-dependent protease n=1 Tax=Parasphingorhabdus sp. TaxID=2709688 RepID=UPI0032650E75